MKLFHGTTSECWPEIAQTGLSKQSSFASERAFALTWRGLDAVVLEVDVPEELLRQMKVGTRLMRGLNCVQYTMPVGMTIPPHMIRVVPSAELVGDLQYLKDLGHL